MCFKNKRYAKRERIGQTMLRKITSDMLLFTGDIDDSQTNTFLTLDDYNWMSYKLVARLKTKEMGILDVTFSYFGLVTSTMEIKQVVDGSTKEYTYEYPTEIFKEHVVQFLTSHIKSWDSDFAFDGEDDVLSFYNDVIERGTLVREKTIAG